MLLMKLAEIESKFVFLVLMCCREPPTRNALIVSFVVLSFFGACLDALGLINPVGIKRLQTLSKRGGCGGHTIQGEPNKMSHSVL